MKKATLFFSITILFIISGCSNKPIYKSAWQSQELTAGDFNKNWDVKMQYNSKSQMLYGISNDSQNLYVRLKVTDPVVKRKIMMTGLTYWINLNGKNDDNMELTFPIQQSKQIDRGKLANLDNGNASGNTNKSGIIKFNEKYLNGMSEIAIVGFDGETESRLLGNTSIRGINAILKTDSLHTFYYEVQIPLDMIFENPNDFLSGSTNYFSYGFETGYLKMPSSQQGGRGGGMKGQGGGQGRGSQYSSSNSQQRSSMQEMSQASKFSIKKASLSTSR